MVPGVDGADAVVVYHLAFICTGPSEGFDPLCNPTQGVLLGVGVLIVVAAVIGAFVAAVVTAYRRWRNGRVAVEGGGR